jgi:hypothetical protein
MVSISSLAQSRLNPRDILQQQLTSSIETGKVKASDKAALSASLDTIDQTLRQNGPPQRPEGLSRVESPGANGPKNAKSRIDALVQQQVSSGALTAEQGAELKQVFADAFAQGKQQGGGRSDENNGPDGVRGKGPGGPPPGGGPGGPGGPKGAGGPPPKKKDDDDDDSSSSSSSRSTSASSSSSASTALTALLKKLQDSLEKTSTYAASGNATTKTTAKSLVVDYTA